MGLVSRRRSTGTTSCARPRRSLRGLCGGHRPGHTDPSVVYRPGDFPRVDSRQTARVLRQRWRGVLPASRWQRAAQASFKVDGLMNTRPFSPDGTPMVLETRGPKTGNDITIATIGPSVETRPLLNTAHPRAPPRFRPMAVGWRISRTSRGALKCTCGRSRRSIRDCGRSRRAGVRTAMVAQWA